MRDGAIVEFYGRVEGGSRGWHENGVLDSMVATYL
jgi:hypothetical protein